MCSGLPVGARRGAVSIKCFRFNVVTTPVTLVIDAFLFIMKV